MQVCLVIEKMIPEANSSNYGVTIFPDGHWEITKWELNVPQPTLDELQVQWNIMNLADSKQNKLNELNNACNNAILGGFNHTINSIDYHFSFDLEAQFNFQGVSTLLDKGLIQEQEWTVTNNGVYERIMINKSLMDELSLVILQHKDSNIKHLRNELMPLVEQAQVVEDLDKIVW